MWKIALSHLWVGDVEVGDILARDEVLCSALEHKPCKVLHDGLCLKMKIMKHFIILPASNQEDDIGVNMGQEKGHSTTGMKGAGGDVIGEETNGGAEHQNQHAKDGGDVSWCDRVPGSASSSIGLVVGGQWGGGWGMVCVQVEHVMDG